MVSVSLIDGFSAWFGDVPPAPPSEQSSAKPEASGGTGLVKIVIVEDELLVAWHLESILMDLGYEVCGIYSSGEAVLEEIDNLAPRVVLMDINLGAGMDGVTTATKMRRRSEVPIIFVTAYGDSDTKDRVQSAIPGSQIVSKPVEPARLREAIDIALSAG